MLGVLRTLLLIEGCDNGIEKIACGFVAIILGDSHEPDIVLFQHSAVDAGISNRAREARKAMNKHHIEGPWRLPGVGYHFLEGWSPVVGARRARLYIDIGDLIAVGFGVGLALALLVGKREVLLCLPRR
nr:hypothetical protein [Limibacillus halophilus]